MVRPECHLIYHVIENDISIISMSCLALYFTMSCMSTVGFGNIASATDYERSFGICMMIISALLYAAIFGHMTTIIQQMTSATVR